MEKAIYDISGKEQGKKNLPDNIFGLEVKDFLIYDKIKNELANQRLGCASTKTRAEVRGGGRKPWRQKGTGRARQGSIRSPQWVGGGVAFGPRPKDYSYQLPKKVKRLALLNTLNFKLSEENTVKIVKDFMIESGKTKEANAIIKSINGGLEERTLVIFLEDDEKLKRALRNIPWVKYMSAKRLAAHEMFYAKHVIIFEKAIDFMQEYFAAFSKNN